MYRLTHNWSVTDGTSYKGAILLVYGDIALAFGAPIESDGFKVSGEWAFYNEDTEAIFTLYDWKSTSLYDDDLPSVEQFRSDHKSCWFNIGGNGKGCVEEFKMLLKKHIEWTKYGRDVDVHILGHKDPIGHILIK